MSNIDPAAAWANERACADVRCREARADERRRIIAELREMGSWGDVAAQWLEGKHVDGLGTFEPRSRT